MDVKAKLNDGGINHPEYYNSGEYEAISVIEDWKLGFHLGNAVKYIARAGRKNRDEYIKDLEKAVWYISRFIELTSNITDIS